MNHLAIDTSGPIASIALIENGTIVATRTLESPQRHSQTLFPALEGMRLHERKIDRIIVGLGPGSFSGIRVAVAATSAIAAVKHSALIGVCSALSIARQLSHVTRLGVFADARRGEYYLTLFEHGQLLRGPLLIPLQAVEEELQKVTLAVSSEKLPLIPERAHPQAEDFFAIPENDPSWITQLPLEPIYLRTPIA